MVNTVYNKGDHEPTLQINFDDISMKTKLLLTRVGLTYGELKFDEKSFFKTSLGYTAFGIINPLKQMTLIFQAYILVMKV